MVQQAEAEATLASLAGTMWRLVEVRAFNAGQEVPSPIGRHPMGFVMFVEDRILVAVTDARPAQEPGPASRKLLSYTGTYRFDGTDIVTATDAASSPDLMVEQVREMRFEAARHFIATPKQDLLGRGVRLDLVW